MVIDAYQPRSPKLPSDGDGEPKFKIDQPVMATPWDRLAATVIDWLLVLTPILVVVGAPLKRVMIEALVLDSQSPFARAMIISALSGLLVVLLYQSLMTYFYGGTLGKLAFGLRVVDVWTHKAPTLGASFVRSVALISEVLLAGLPWLSIFANVRRRAIHDRVSDTVVISTKRPGSLAPGIMEATFIRGVHSAFLAIFALCVTVVGVNFLKSAESEDTVLNWLESGKDDSPRCEEVTEALAEEPQTMQIEERLELAMELFAAGIVDQACVQQEAEWVMNQPEGETPLAYLAKAFATADNSELSNAYLEKACELGPVSESCLMTSIVQKWSEDDWDKVAELFSALPTPSSVHVSIWKVRYFMKQAKYEQALHVINQLAGRASLASYLVPERAKALWRANQFEQSRLVALTGFETLHGTERLNLAGWMCYEEMAKQCSEHEPSACETFVKEANNQSDTELQPTGWMAMILLKEKCQNRAALSEYADLKEASENTPAEKLIKALELWSQGDELSAKKAMTDLFEDSKLPEPIRNEGLRRLVVWSKESEDMTPWIDQWQSLKPGHRRTVGPVLFRALRAKGRLAEALNVGWQLLDENRADLQINRDLVVTAYQLGRRKDAWKLLKSYRERNDILNHSRSPASSDEFAGVAKLLTKEYGEP